MRTRREFLKIAGSAAAAAGLSSLATGCHDKQARRDESVSQDRPNIIFILADDLGYGDLGCYGAQNIKTPRIDQMAQEGIRFTSFYAQTVCGPSRAALMTGCYPLRVAKEGNRMDIHPYLHPQEVTVAEVLRDAGYATGCFGKWDLAGHTQTAYSHAGLPTRQGFDYYFGTPTSNDRFVNLLRNEERIEEKADLNTLTRRYTDEAIAFIRQNRNQPFFVYLPHTMPHTTLGVSAPFRGKSQGGLYGDVVEEMDWNVGRILDTIKELALDQRTYVVFASDNGPWWIKKEQGGSAYPLRGAKTSSWEGGLRVPCIMWAPGRIPAGRVCDQIATTMDLLPTLARLGGGRIPVDRAIDGHDILALVHGEKGATSPTQAFFYYVHTHLQAVRAGKWKLHLPRPANPPWTPNWAGHIDPKDVFEIKTPLLFDLEEDIGERHDAANEHPDIVKKLLDFAEWARADIGDYDRLGKNARFFDPGPKRPDIEKWNASLTQRGT